MCFLQLMKARTINLGLEVLVRWLGWIVGAGQLMSSPSKLYLQITWIITFP